MTGFGGAVKTQITNIESYVQSVPDTFSNWNASAGVSITHTNVATTGCQSVFSDNIEVNFTVTNQLAAPVKGAINISVYNQRTGDLLDSKVLMLAYFPGNATYAYAKFSLVTQELQPTFLVKVNFPTGTDSTTSSTKQVSLLEFLLMQVGVLQE